jgi:hypothetical protein
VDLIAIIEIACSNPNQKSIVAQLKQLEKMATVTESAETD